MPFKKFCFLPLLFFFFISYATKYYVSPFGDDTNNGTSITSPWKTIAKVNRHQFNPGDKILFQNGGIWRETLYPRYSGSFARPITYSNYGTGAKPIINGADIYSGWSLYKTNIWLRNSPLSNNVSTTIMVDGVIFKKVNSLASLIERTFYIDKTTSPNKIYIYSTQNINRGIVEISVRRNAVYVNRIGYLIISNLNVINCTDAGIRMDADNMPNGVPVPKFNGHSLIDNVTASNSVNSGIVTGTGYCYTTIKNSSAYANGNGFYAYEDADYTLFQLDTAYDNYNQVDPFTDGNGFGVYKSSFNTIENCIAYNNKTGCGFEVDLANSDSAIVIRYNVAYGNGSLSEWVGIKTGNLLGTNSNFIYYNLSYLNGNDPKDKMGREFYHHNGNISFYNNTAYTTGDLMASALTIAGHGTVVIKNNLFYCYGGKNMFCIRRYNTAILFADNNLYYSNSTAQFYDGTNAYDFAGWRRLKNNDAHSLNADPIFEFIGSKFTLNARSPGINNGIDVGLTRDILGKPIVGLPDIGAYETAIQTNTATDLTSAVFPNPTKNTLNLRVKDYNETKVEIIIFDFSGRIIIPTFIKIKPKGDFSIPIDVSDLDSGIYIIKVSINRKVMSISFLKD